MCTISRSITTDDVFMGQTRFHSSVNNKKGVPSTKLRIRTGYSLNFNDEHGSAAITVATSQDGHADPAGRSRFAKTSARVILAARVWLQIIVSNLGQLGFQFCFVLVNDGFELW